MPNTLKDWAVAQPTADYNRRADYSSLINELTNRNVDQRPQSRDRFGAMQNKMYGASPYASLPGMNAKNRIQNVDLANRVQAARQAQYEKAMRDRYNTLASADQSYNDSNLAWKNYEDYIHGEEGDLQMKKDQQSKEDSSSTTGDIMNGLATAAQIALMFI